jgi:hypothetical protein
LENPKHMVQRDVGGACEVRAGWWMTCLSVCGSSLRTIPPCGMVRRVRRRLLKKAPYHVTSCFLKCPLGRGKSIYQLANMATGKNALALVGARPDRLRRNMRRQYLSDNHGSCGLWWHLVLCGSVPGGKGYCCTRSRTVSGPQHGSGGCGVVQVDQVFRLSAASARRSPGFLFACCPAPDAVDVWRR